MTTAMRVVAVLLLAACGGSAKGTVPTVKPTGDTQTHATEIAGLVQPMIDAEISSSIVVGIYDAGKSEVYGFGKGPDGKPPTGTTLYELGSVTQIYTALMFADSLQRREVSLDTNLADLVPPGVTVPTFQNTRITLGMLALHTSGLPKQPPSLRRGGQDPYAAYNDDALYADLINTKFDQQPGTTINASTFGAGVLGFVLGKKIAGNLATALSTRVLLPLNLVNTYFKVPASVKARREVGTNTDLQPVPNWNWDALAGAGGLVSTARDQLALIDAELDAASGSKQTLRAAMRVTQEEQLPATTGPNEGLGWDIDTQGRFWHNGATGGFRSFLGFDPKTRRGVVILSSSATSLVDHLASDLYKMLGKEEYKAFVPPSFDGLAQYAGTYRLGQFDLTVSVEKNRVYVTGKGEQPLRLIPLTDHEMWFEAQQAVVVFEKEGDKVARAVFVIGAQRLAAPRVE
jgi:serine-type D-Ala-D-Ala carboxypeptidase/endopeptidase